MAASLALGFGTTGTIALSGAGAEATNVIVGHSNAYIDYSDLVISGTLDISSSNNSTINSTVAAVAASGSGMLGVGIGAAVSRNLIGWSDPNTSAPFHTTAYLNNSSLRSEQVELTPNESLVRANDKYYRYIGTGEVTGQLSDQDYTCLLYTSDAADE